MSSAFRRGIAARSSALLMAGWAALGAATASAQSIDVSGDAAIVSDYRYRGISNSGHEVAVQGGATLSYDMASINVWTSTIEPPSGGRGQEFDVSAALTYDIEGFVVTGAAVAYLYVNMDNSNYVEIMGTVTRRIDPVTLILTLAYTPDQPATGSLSNFYISGGAKIDVGSTTLSAYLGRETGAFALGGKWDWQISASRRFERFVASATYVDTDRTLPGRDGKNLAGSGLLFGLQMGF